MSLGNIFEEYVNTNTEYVKFVDNIINNDFKGYNEAEIKNYLTKSKESFKKLMEDVEKITNEKEDGLFVKDVKYSIADGYFLSIDLYNFYNSKQIERFKMRGVNYIRKGRLSNVIRW